MASISSIGVGSGLPLAELLENLRTAEEAPLRALKSRYATFETRLSAYGTLKSAVASLQDAAKSLSQSNSFGAMKATSSSPDVVTANVSEAALALEGSYDIDVMQLAIRQSLATQGVASRNEAIGSGGTLEIVIDGITHTVELGNDTSLEGVRNAINAAGIGVSALIVNNGKEGNPYQLVLTANETGTRAQITSIAVQDNEALHELMVYGDGLRGDETFDITVSQTVAARNAIIKVNGIQIESAGNTVKDAIEGITLELSDVTAADKPITVTITKNNSPAISAVQGFVNAYNALHSTLRSLTNYNVENQQSSALTGDSVARSVQTQARQFLSYRIDGEIGTLSQLGITTNPSTGELTLDTEKLTRLLNENPEAVDHFFRSEAGFARRVTDATEAMLRTEGLIDNAAQGTKKTLDDLTKQFDRVERRIEDAMARYQAQFIALDALVAQMNSTSSYLAQQLDMLTAQAKAAMK